MSRRDDERVARGGVEAAGFFGGSRIKETRSRRTATRHPECAKRAKDLVCLAIAVLAAGSARAVNLTSGTYSGTLNYAGSNVVIPVGQTITVKSYGVSNDVTNGGRLTIIANKITVQGTINATTKPCVASGPSFSRSAGSMSTTVMRKSIIVRTCAVNALVSYGQRIR